ncbi:MAG: hypothetical protein AB8C95_12260, partial [Phycisphaeraceae bacterium]
SQLYRQVASAHGAEALAEILLDRAVQTRLKQEGIELNTEDIDAERDKLLVSMDSDPDQAARLLRQMREQRGLDDNGFKALLRRNAGLRAIVRDQVTINEVAIKQAYDLRYGKKYQVRLIVTEDLDSVVIARRKVVAGDSFTDLAIKLSTDSSARQGGLLSPISSVDSTYPKAIRDALPKLKMDTVGSRLSQVIALDQGYAILWLESVLSPNDPPKLEQVRDDLASVTRSELERVRMRQLARTLIEQSDVVVLDPALDEAWRRQRGAIQNP